VYKSNNNSEQTVEQGSKATRDALITARKNNRSITLKANTSKLNKTTVYCDKTICWIKPESDDFARVLDVKLSYIYLFIYYITVHEVQNTHIVLKFDQMPDHGSPVFRDVETCQKHKSLFQVNVTSRIGVSLGLQTIKLSLCARSRHVWACSNYVPPAVGYNERHRASLYSQNAV